MRAPDPTKGLRIWYKRAAMWVGATVTYAGPKLVRLTDAAGRHVRVARPAWGFTFDVRGFDHA